ncbi:MAG: substrate-binding domain-containing protein [Clostridia bacterium]|nr:substrate-binding domain-containing protein [Clostridia bacterium]
MNKFFKMFAVVLTLCLVVSLFTACGNDKVDEIDDDGEKVEDDSKDEEMSQGDGEKKVIGVSLFYRRDEYYKDIEASFMHEAEKAGYELLIQDADSDPAKQTQQMEDFVQKGVDAIALACADPAGLVPAIEDAIDKGIPVFTYDGPSESEKVISHIGFDFYEDGASVGRWVKKYIEENLDGKAQVAIIDFPQSAIVCGLRAQGFREVMESMEGVEIVAQQDGKATRTDSMAVMENILTAHPDVDAVFGINYDTAAGAASAIEAAGRDDIIVTGGAWGVEPFEQLESNHPILKAFFVTSPAVQAHDTIQAIKDHFDGKELPKEIKSESTVYDADNIKELDWKAIVERRQD